MTDLAAADRDTRTIEQDLACIGCEYNLRMQPLDAACPECGRPVRETLDFPRLERSAPRWLTSLVDSVTILLASFVADVVILLIGVRDIPIALSLGMIPWGLTWFAVWLLTRPEPGAADAAGRARAWTLRMFATMPYVAFVLVTNTGGGVGRSEILLVLCLLASAAPAGWMYYDHLARSATRLPAPSLALQARLCRWLFAGAALVSVSMLALAPPAGPTAVLHVLPRAGIPGASDLAFIGNVLLAGADLMHPRVLAALLVSLTTVAAVAVLVQFRIAFARAANASKRVRSAEVGARPTSGGRAAIG